MQYSRNFFSFSYCVVVIYLIYEGKLIKKVNKLYQLIINGMVVLIWYKSINKPSEACIFSKYKIFVKHVITRLVVGGQQPAIREVFVHLARKFYFYF